MRMESDEFDFLAPAYVRSFLRNYAAYLRVESAPLVEEFDRRYGRSKLETASIVALEKRAKANAPRRLLNSWATAAIIAIGVMAGLAAIGVANSPDEEGGRDSIAQEQPSPEATEQAAEDATPTPTPEESTIAFDKGIDLEVVASKAACWLEVYSDGELLFYETLQEGDRESFRAEHKMFVKLGYPDGVEMIVNGRNIGTPGGDDPIELVFPRDIRSFL